jgi:RNase P/RNase MRP subunit POP5
MQTRAIACFLVLVTAVACSKEPAPSPPPAPVPSTHEAEQVVAELYREHDAKRGPFFQTDSRALVDKYFEPSLANLIWKDAVDAKGEVGALDFDPLYDAQDVEPKNLIVHEAQVDADNVRMPVSFESYGEKRQLTYVLVHVGGTWKIADIRYADGRTLRKVY